MSYGTLFLIPVALAPSLRASVLPEEVATLAAQLNTFVVENAKSARHTLKWLGHPGPLQSLNLLTLNEHSTDAAIHACLQPLLDGNDVGLMSEAGCPAIADPGAQLVRLAHEHGIKVVPLVGPSAILLALIASGLNGQHFAFRGYLPTAKTEREQALKELERDSAVAGQTQIFIETPYRNQALLESLLAVCDSGTLLCIATDLTGPTQTIATKPIREWRQSMPDVDKRPTVFLLLHARF